MAPRNFVSDQAAVRVVFGAGSIDRLAAEVQRVSDSGGGGGRPLVLSTQGRRQEAEALAKKLGGQAAVHAEAAMHVPVENVRAAREAAARHDADCLVAIGGGSTIGLAKAIALERPIPIVAVPTTYSGSEMTPIWGLTEEGRKRTGRDNRVQPKTVIYDPNLTLGLPARVSGPSGMNAIAHALEALYAQDANPLSTLAAAEAIGALSRSLPIVIREPLDLDARADALHGAWLAGYALSTTTMGLHHKLCHTLGGTFNLPHAEVHTVILPHAAAFNRDAAPEAMRIVAAALGSTDAAAGLFDLAVRVGAPTALKDIGMSEDGLDRAARLATENPTFNPRPIDYAAVRQLLENAYRGTRPA
jgi:maleylacetate reductase